VKEEVLFLPLLEWEYTVEIRDGEGNEELLKLGHVPRLRCLEAV